MVKGAFYGVNQAHNVVHGMALKRQESYEGPDGFGPPPSLGPKRTDTDLALTTRDSYDRFRLNYLAVDETHGGVEGGEPPHTLGSLLAPGQSRPLGTGGGEEGERDREREESRTPGSARRALSIQIPQELQSLESLAVQTLTERAVLSRQNSFDRAKEAREKEEEAKARERGEGEPSPSVDVVPVMLADSEGEDSAHT
ncbi:hypothetical protein KIPB_011991 [Kipferlia bialata]|uniref:Uncharacterized protein n=1 Tax=Kipferlia bialata TaxID=797122 RepID=A0A9K3GP81_9EUKA|nr:hypothetical protein KIPB_011991 [Kipferlia bialata]|eukprot:g11991.t1